MSKINDGGSAFPGRASNGMSLRDYAAIKVAASVMAMASGLGGVSKNERREVFNQVADISYEMADAMLAAREARA